MNKPPQDIIAAFSSDGQPQLLPGGQQTTYKVNDIVLKPTDNEKESSWVAEVFSMLKEHLVFRIAKPVKSVDGRWVVDGWIANKFVAGEHKTDRWSEVIRISQAFHEALKEVERPSFFDERKDPWAIADRMAWGEEELPDHQLTREVFAAIVPRLQRVTLPSQVIHGDISENILFASDLPPAVIDFSPYWRPATFAIAIVLIDAIVWRGASERLLNRWREIEQFDQLLLRAFLRRICEAVESERQFNKDSVGVIQPHLSILRALLRLNSECSNS